MNDLCQKYLDGRLSRRHFLSSMVSLGFSAYAATSVAAELKPFLPESVAVAGHDSHSSRQTVQGTGGELLVAQLEAADMNYIFISPSTTAGPVYDALVDSERLQIIESVHEGSLVAMADGYARRSGKVPFVMISRAGLPNAMTQMYNSWKDNIPMVVAVNGVSMDAAGQDGFHDIDHLGEMTQPITKWHWRVKNTRKIPEVTRRAIKFASTRPGGPVFLSYPADTLRMKSTVTVIDQKKFAIPMQIRPDPGQIQQVADMLLNARNPLLYVGSEITVSGAEKEVIELAELLGLPVALAGIRAPVHWSLPFPTRHPLYLGQYQANLRYPGKIDVMVNLGGKMPDAGARLKIDPGTRLVQARMDPTSLARNYPTDIAIFADIKLAVQDLIAALHRQSSPRELRHMRDSRYSKTQDFTADIVKLHQSIARERWDNDPISTERLVSEMDDILEKDTCIVSEADAGLTTITNLLSYGGKNKQYLSNSGIALGWGLPAAFGAKLAHPDTPVVAIVGEGAFLFSGPQPLWSYSRYKAPITVIVLNNKSYNNERNRIWTHGGRQFETGRDMVCYLGDPDVNFVKLGEAFDVPGEIVNKASKIKDALKRAKKENENGRPYLLDVHVERRGIGSLSTWHPKYSIEALRQRKV